MSTFGQDEEREPVSTACDGPCCRDCSLACLHNLFDMDDPLALRLATWSRPI